MKNNKQYSSPLVRMFQHNCRRKRGHLEPPVLPMVSEDEPSDDNDEFYEYGDTAELFDSSMSRISGIILSFIFIIFGICEIISPYKKVIPLSMRRIEVSTVESVISGLVVTLLGVALMWFCWLRHLKK
jgi:hypothetical protein